MSSFLPSSVQKLLAVYRPAAVAAVDIALDAFSDFENFILKIDGLRPVTDAVHALLFFSTDGGSVFTRPVSWGQLSFTSGGASVVGYQNNSVTPANLSSNGIQVGSAAGEGLSATLEIFSPLSASRSSRMTGVVTQTDPSGGIVELVLSASNVPASVEPWTDIRIAFGSGNIAEGTIRLYGVRG